MNLCVLATHSELFQWPAGWRYVPPPTACQACGAPATEFLKWFDNMRRVDEFAGCPTCAKRKLAEAEGQRYAVSVYPIGGQA